MKKFILILPLLLLSVFLSAQDLKSYIPSNATFIVHIDGKRINNEVDFDAIRNSDMYKDFIFKMLNNKSAEERAITKLFETPDETGLNIKSDIYVYSIPADDDDKIVTITSIHLLNSNKFSGFVKDLFNKNRKLKTKKAGKGIYYLYNGSSGLIIWNNEKAFYCDLPYSYKYQNGYNKAYILKTINTVFRSPVENSILSNTKIVAALIKESDITYIFNSSSLKHTPWLYESINKEEFIKDTTLINDELFADSYSYSYLNFENGSIVFSGEQFYGTKLASVINPIFNVRPSGKLANLMFQTPVTSYFCYAFNMTETKKFINKTFNYNADSILISYIRSSQSNRFNGNQKIMMYQNEIDTIDYLVNGPNEDEDESNIKSITDSGTVYNEEKEVTMYYYDSDNEKYEHKTLNWFQLDSLEARKDTLYEFISVYKDTLALKTFKESGIKTEELWDIFKGEFLFLFHAMISIDKKYKTYEMDEEYNYVEVEKTKKIPMPLYSVAATINDFTIFKKYLNLLIEKGILQKEKNRYLVVLGDIDQYVWIQDSLCILTNDNNFNPNKRSNSNKNDFETTNYNRIVGNQSSAFIEIGKIMASSAQYTDDKQSAEILEILAKYFDETVFSTDFKSVSNYSSETQILFNDSKKNSLNSLYDLINEMYVHFNKH